MRLHLIVLADIAAQRSNHQLAAQLLAAGDALREAIGEPVPATHRAGVERFVTMVQMQLGRGGFTLAYAAGRNMPLEQALAQGLEEAR